MAVARIAAALRAAGIEIWFDQSELRGGDVRDAAIRKQIKSCALFIPVISRNAHARGEGYFRLEWKLAVDRSHLIAVDLPFLVPVVIDDTPSTDELPNSVPHTQPLSIAVLPLTNESGDVSQQYLSDGISEDLITTLTQLSGLRVIGRSSSFQFRDSKEDARSIGAKLGVTHLLEGSVRRSRPRLYPRQPWIVHVTDRSRAPKRRPKRASPR